MSRLEHKSLSLEVKEIQESGIFEGYGAAFENVDAVGDIIKQGAFEKSLAEYRKAKKMPKLLWQHDYREPIGSWLEISEDETGLPVKGRLLCEEVQRAKEAHALLKVGAIEGMSIGYVPRDYSIDHKTGIRTLKQVDLVEISLVTFPANDQARVTGVKSASINSEDDLVALLREQAGLSWKEAEQIARYGFKARKEPDSQELAIIRKIIEHNKGAYR